MAAVFDMRRFRSVQFVPRTETVSVPDLGAFFPDGAEPLWSVRGLTGHELGRVNEAVDRNRNVNALVEALLSADPGGKADAIREILGLSEDKAPSDIVRRIELLTAGSVDPAMDHEASVKLCTHFPIEFFMLTNAILRLTGKGSAPVVKKKPTPSGGTPG